MTLLEVTLSVAVMSVLMGGIASAIVLATHALPSKGSASGALMTASQVASELVDDLHCAKSFTERTATTVEFTVADRPSDPDADAETIRYEWSGTPGDPLTRTYNGSAVDVASDVYDLTLTYDTRTDSSTATQTVTGQSPEIELASFISWGGITPTSFAPGPTDWMAESFTITPPGGVTEMNISRVLIMAQEYNANPNATITVGVYKPATLGEPIPRAAPIGTPTSILTSSLYPFFAWTDFTFSDVEIDTADVEYVIKVSASALGTCKAQYYYWKSAPADSTIYIYTTDGGASWDPRASAHDDNDMSFRVYGTYETTTTQDVTTTTYYQRSVGITLQVSDQTSARVDTAAAVLNEPEVPGT